MSLLKLLNHLFLPHQSNNLRPKLLHSSTLLGLSLLLLVYQGLISFFPKTGIRVLGYAATISVEEVVRLTNEKRVQAGLAPLTFNSTLSAAAKAKGEDMLIRDYWAHTAPDGTEPWKFFGDAGYKYRYAGENLARDFSNASSAVEAWMASPSHKDNLLSPKYKDIGVAVMEGDLAGADTTLIVQLFGTSYTETLPTVTQAEGPVSVALAKEEETLTASPVPAEVGRRLISPFGLTRKVSLVMVALLLVVFVVDAVVVFRKNYARISGRSFAHISFLGMILAVLVILKAGQIL